MVSAAAIAAARASISTPVRSMACTRASMRTTPAPSSQATSTSAPARTMGWQSGRMSGVRFAAMMPASRAAASASPFSSRPSFRSLSVSREQRSSARAIATPDVRQVRDLEIRLRQAGLDRRWQLLELLLDDRLEHGARRLRRRLERFGVQLVRSREVYGGRYVVLRALCNQPEVVLGPRVWRL